MNIGLPLQRPAVGDREIDMRFPAVLNGILREPDVAFAVNDIRNFINAIQRLSDPDDRRVIPGDRESNGVFLRGE